MSFFIVTALPVDGKKLAEHAAEIGSTLEQHVPAANCLRLHDFAWLVHVDGNSQDLADDLEHPGGVLIALSQEVSGIGPNAIAEWIDQRSAEDAS